MEKISIIIPVYKVEEYLDDCIESVVNQTYQNLEIILVDDGSIDNCPKMCDAWAKKDQRIKVVHKKNGGLSSARNAGIDVMTGDYVMFVDSDDSIHSQTCEILLNNLQKSDSDISMASSRNVFEIKNLKEKKYNLSEIDNLIFENDEVYELIFNKKIPMIMTSWMKLYKKEIFESLRFDEGKLHEDEFIIHKTLNLCKRLIFCDLPLYNYLQRRGGIIKSSYSEKRLQILEALENRIDFTKQNHPKYERDAIIQYMKMCMYCYYRVKFAKLDKTILNEVKQKIDKYYKQGYSDRKIKLFYKAPWLFEKLLYIKLKLNGTI